MLSIFTPLLSSLVLIRLDGAVSGRVDRKGGELPS